MEWTWLKAPDEPAIHDRERWFATRGKSAVERWSDRRRNRKIHPQLHELAEMLYRWDEPFVIDDFASASVSRRRIRSSRGRYRPMG